MASEKAVEHAAVMLCGRDNPAGAACNPPCETCKVEAKQVLDVAAAVDGNAQLSRYSDEEIAAEYFRRAQAKLGDPRIAVGTARLK